MKILTMMFVLAILQGSAFAQSLGLGKSCGAQVANEVLKKEKNSLPKHMQADFTSEHAQASKATLEGLNNISNDLFPEHDLAKSEKSKADYRAQFDWIIEQVKKEKNVVEYRFDYSIAEFGPNGEGEDDTPISHVWYVVVKDPTSKNCSSNYLYSRRFTYYL